MNIKVQTSKQKALDTIYEHIKEINNQIESCKARLLEVDYMMSMGREHYLDVALTGTQSDTFKQKAKDFFANKIKDANKHIGFFARLLTSPSYDGYKTFDEFWENIFAEDRVRSRSKYLNLQRSVLKKIDPDLWEDLHTINRAYTELLNELKTLNKLEQKLTQQLSEFLQSLDIIHSLPEDSTIEVDGTLFLPLNNGTPNQNT